MISSGLVLLLAAVISSLTPMPAVAAPATLSQAIVPPGPVALTGPGGTIGVVTPTFSWQARPEATTYWFWLTDLNTGTTVVNPLLSPEAVCSGGTCAYQPAGLTLANGGSYRWWVQARNAAGEGPWGAGLDLAVTVLPGLVALTGPGGTTSVATPTFSWQARPEATTYWFWLTDLNTGTTVANPLLSPGETCGGGTCAYQPAGLTLANGSSYRWWVQARNAAGEGPWGAGLEFSVTTPDCLIRPNEAIINNKNAITYTDLPAYPFKYRDVLINDYDYYYGCALGACRYAPDSGYDGDYLLQDDVLLMYLKQKHLTPKKTAIVLIHGESSMPDDFFEDNQTYLNVAGRQLFDEGFDVYAPYVTHNSRFLNARRRAASLRGEDVFSLDVRRIMLLLQNIQGEYDQIHIAGVDYGGAVALLTYQRLVQENSPYLQKIGLVISMEGWYSVRSSTKIWQQLLLDWNWEMAYSTIDFNSMVPIMQRENVFMALGSCSSSIWRHIMPDGAGLHRVDYPGPHEFNLDAFHAALQSYSAGQVISATATATATATASPTKTATTTPSATPTKTATATLSATPTATSTSIALGTGTPAASVTAVPTPLNTSPGPVTLVGPRGAVRTATATFNWQARPEATAYWFWLTNLNTGAIVANPILSSDAVCTGETCSYQPPGLTFDDGWHRWWVQARNAAGEGPWGTGLDFTVTKSGCVYLTNESIINDGNSLLYSDLANSGFKYRNVLINDYDYYFDCSLGSCQYVPDGDYDGESIKDGKILLMFRKQKHVIPSRTAVVLIHGSASDPDDFFEDNSTYLNVAGQQLFDEGYDVYAPYVTHNSRLLNARRRAASLNGESTFSLDVKRIALLLQRIQGEYDEIHIAGVSYGGTVALLTYQQLIQDNSPLLSKVGMVLSIEGWYSLQSYSKGWPNLLFTWDWEMVFSTVNFDALIPILQRENVYMALGSCGDPLWGYIIPNVNGLHRVNYTGPHEFNMGAFHAALQSYNASRASSSPTPIATATVTGTTTPTSTATATATATITATIVSAMTPTTTPTGTTTPTSTARATATATATATAAPAMTATAIAAMTATLTSTATATATGTSTATVTSTTTVTPTVTPASTATATATEAATARAASAVTAVAAAS